MNELSKKLQETGTTVGKTRRSGSIESIQNIFFYCVIFIHELDIITKEISHLIANFLSSNTTKYY